MIYLDYAATSFPKAPGVGDAMKQFMENSAGNPGRSGHHLSIAASKLLFEVREALSNLFNMPTAEKVILTYNATYALNICLNMLLKPGDTAVTSSIEHNAVMRPLRAMEQKGLNLIVVPNNPDGTTDLAGFQNAITKKTKLVVINHASNIIGIIQPIREIGRIAHEKGALFLVDSAQTAGVLSIDMQKDNIDLLAFTGHKGLHGPTGTGGLLINDSVDVNALEPFILGGTGSRSEEERQPVYMPDKFESGTQNTIGFAGLLKAIEFINNKGLDEILAHEIALTRRIIKGLIEIPKVQVYGNLDVSLRTAVVSFNIMGKTCSDVGDMLNDEYDIMSRIGMHCSPSAHRTIGTFPQGTIRVAPGLFTTEKDIDDTISAVKKICEL
ncbi:MAG: aminotransferase class V-fold PLP-dependent enzyme [Planctomycetes bacterium]|nr:aminotransferase class V-fold PLP-dependent enzyme [Planctomycetota bacterium]